MPVNANDPRVRRTRQLLTEAFYSLLEEKKNIYSISVYDIAARATVNRATFYAHFEDKFAFLEYWMTEKFESIIHKRIPVDAKLTSDNLQTLVQTLFDFLFRFRQYITLGDRQFEPLFETAMQKKLYQLLLQWLCEADVEGISQESMEATANVISWGIFGSAVQCSRDPQQEKSDILIKNVLEVVTLNLAPYLEPT
ncbi:TetR/AcrR family transcriptional regulator [Paenibacillus sp. SN-8-1]|uniref:TetR/AcrR family transcriptional regulator n=1 Tax=Paenibacillus sp. SN-8-1 TaxID=3435409 RepID=UPI003D9A1AFC